MPDTNITSAVDSLANDWQDRNSAMRDAFELIRLKDDLTQGDLKGVISPDPRTSYDMAVWLLNPKNWQVRFDTNGYLEDELRAVSGLERTIEREFSWQQRLTRTSLYGSTFEHAVKLYLMTGWLAVAALPTEPHWKIGVYHPATVFPEYDEQGALVGLARRYKMQKSKYDSYSRTNQWGGLSTGATNLTVRSLWKLFDGIVYHGVAVENTEVRPMSPVPDLVDIPFFCVPAGGLPDDGTLGTRWSQFVGQSLVANVLELQTRVNEMMSYMHLILRDTANPVTFTRTAQGESPVTPENRNKRGQIYDLRIGEDIVAMGTPPLPPDFQTHMFNMHNQQQRSLFPDVSFGNFNQSVSTFLMSQATAGTQKILGPFHQGLTAVFGEVITQAVRLHQMTGQSRMLKYPLVDIPEDPVADFHYDIIIPGDFIQRVNSARIANPEFRLSQQTIVEAIMPEVQNYADERRRINEEESLNTEMFQLVNQVMQFRQFAAEANALGNVEAERLAMAAAEKVEAQIVGSPARPQPTLREALAGVR